MDLLLNGVSGLVATGRDKLEKLDNFFPSAFTNKVSQAPVRLKEERRNQL